MNKVVYKTGKFTVEFAASNQKDLFKEIAAFEETFTMNHTCICGNGDVVHRVRTVDSNDYYELFCPKCFKSFSFGQSKKGDHLFPKYSKGERGWARWEPDQDDEDQPKKTRK